jgi:hypothetical protein
LNEDTGGRRGTRRTQAGRAGFAAVVAGLALLTAACGSSSSTPAVASLGTSSDTPAASSSASAPTGNPTQLLDQWAACMRRAGYPGLADPSIDANKVIHITVPPGTTQSQVAAAKLSPCYTYLTAAATALGGGAPSKPDQAELLAFSQCMRANGVKDFPDPNGKGLAIRTSPGSDLNPDNPVFKHAAQVCDQKTGLSLLSGTPQPGSIDVQGVQSPPGTGASGG